MKENLINPFTVNLNSGSYTKTKSIALDMQTKVVPWTAARVQRRSDLAV